MSAPSSRPPIPRPISRASSTPPPVATKSGIIPTTIAPTKVEPKPEARPSVAPKPVVAAAKPAAAKPAAAKPVVAAAKPVVAAAKPIVAAPASKPPVGEKRISTPPPATIVKTPAPSRPAGNLHVRNRMDTKPFEWEIKPPPSSVKIPAQIDPRAIVSKAALAKTETKPVESRPTPARVVAAKPVQEAKLIGDKKPPSERPSVAPVSAIRRVVSVPKTYGSQAPVIRDRKPALEIELEDDDIVEAEAATPSRSAPPPAPPARRSSVPAPVLKVEPLRMPNFDEVDIPTPAWEAAAPEPLPLPAIPPPAAVAFPAPAPAPAFPAAVSAPAPASIPMTVSVPMPVQTPAPASGVSLPSHFARFGSLLDPTDILFDVLSDLNFADTAKQAATKCAESLAKALGARAVFIHMHDHDHGELRALAAYGPRTAALVGSTEPSDDDFIASAVICNGKPVTMAFDGELPRLAPRRLRVIGVNRSVVAVPAMIWKRCAAVIEVIDADDRFAARAADSAAYVAQRLSEYLVERAAA